eukprot:GILJ01001296.1.p1 GENE.GILJ01001296.1~~GILJ01001296.1.p1  ORF type:complete len:620 (-),score=121.68 GILJ01001296.1:152-2011(-)
MASTSIQLLPLLLLLLMHLLLSNAAWHDVFDEDGSGFDDMHMRDGSDAGGAFMESSFSSTMFQPDESVNAVRDWYWNAYQRKAEVNNFITNIRTKIAELVKINEVLDRAHSTPSSVPVSTSVSDMSDLSPPRPPPSVPVTDSVSPSAAAEDTPANQVILSHLEQEEARLKQHIKDLQAIINHGSPPSLIIPTSPTSADAATGRAVAVDEELARIRVEISACEKDVAEHAKLVVPVSVAQPPIPHADDAIVNEIQQLIQKQNQLKDDISKIQKAKELNQEKLKMFLTHVDKQMQTEKQLFETQQRVLAHGLNWEPSKIQPTAQSLTPSLAAQMLQSNKDKVSALLSGVRGITLPPAEAVPPKTVESPAHQMDESLSFIQEAEGLSTAGLSDSIESAITKAMEKLQEISRLLLEKQAKLAASSTVIPSRIDVPPSAPSLPDHSTEDSAVVRTPSLAGRIKDKTAAVEQLRHELDQLIKRMSEQTTEIVHKAVGELPSEPAVEPATEPVPSSGGSLAELITILVRCRATQEIQKHQVQAAPASRSAEEETKRLIALKEMLQKSVSVLEEQKSSLKATIKEELAKQQQTIEAAVGRLDEARKTKLAQVADVPSRVRASSQALA